MKKKESNLRRLISDMSGYRAIFIRTFLILILSKLMLSIAPKVSGVITDYLAEFVRTGVEDTRFFVGTCLILAALYLIGYGCDTFVNKNMVKVFEGLAFRYRNEGQKKLNRLAVSYIDSHSSGDIISRLTGDIQIFITNMESTVPSLIGQSTLLIGVVVCMFVTNWKLTLIYVILLPLNLFMTIKVVGKASEIIKLQRDEVGNLSALLGDTLQNHLITKVYHCEEQKLSEFEKINEDFNYYYRKSRFISGFIIPLSNIISNLAYIALCVFGGIMVIQGDLTIGGFQAFVFYGFMIQQPITTLSSAINQLQSGMAALTRVYEFLDAVEMPEEAPEEYIDPEEVQGEIAFANVSFGYTPEITLMKDVSMAIKPGMKVAIVGPSGAGKTTIINLLMRFYEINGGKITLDGKDVSRISRENLRDNFGMVLQDTWIFEGTVAENIGYGRIGASREEIVEAAKIVKCDTFIEKLPEGYDTVIGGENTSLSEGEKQLITIARTVLSDPKILILDEATSKVDTKTEVIITEAMEKMMEGRTSFVIAHRLYTIRNSDMIVVMKDGDIVEFGNHQQLLAAKGLYATLYK